MLTFVVAYISVIPMQHGKTLDYKCRPELNKEDALSKLETTLYDTLTRLVHLDLAIYFIKLLRMA